MTKVIIIGEQPKEKKLEPIELCSYMDSDGVEPSETEPCDWNNIELICENYRNSSYDLMFCYNSSRSAGELHLGFFNDGIVK